VFLQKVDTQTKKLTNEEDTALVCQCCSKSFSTKNQYNNHKQSKKHKDNEAKAQKKGQVVAEPKVVKKAQREAPKQPPNTICIQPVQTVGESSNSNIINVGGQKVKQEEVDVEEDMIVVENDDGDEDWEDCSSEEEDEDTGSAAGAEGADEETGPSEAIPTTTCLFCSAKSSTLEDNCRHMSKQHSFFIPELQFVTDIEGFLEYLGTKVGDGKMCLLCNYSSKQFHSVSAAQKHMVDKGHCTLDNEKDALLEFSDFYDFSSSYPDFDPNNPDGGDTDSELSSVMADLNVDPSTLELVMPSGARAGHRTLHRYYQQSAVPEHMQHQRQRQMLTGVQSHYKALGWSGCNMSLVIRKKVDATRKQNQQRQQFDVGLSTRKNKLNMRYFRKQYMYAG